MKSTYLTFILDNEYFAINVENVIEVLIRQYITPIPKAPEHILGILNFRGEILPVINIRSKFNLSSADPLSKTCIIVIDLSKEDHKLIIATSVDAVSDVIEIEDDELKLVPDISLNFDGEYITGAIRRDNQFILMVNIEKLLSNTSSEKTIH